MRERRLWLERAKTYLFLCLLLLVTACMPDSFTKWEEDPPPPPPEPGSSVIGSDGSSVDVPPPSGGTAPTSFSYPQSTYGFEIDQEITAQTPTIVGESGSDNTYIFGTVDPITGNSKPLSSVGLAIDQSTGEITGKPTSFANAVAYRVQAYHVESGSTLSTDLVISAANKIDEIFYAQPTGMKLVLEVDDASQFSTSAPNNEVANSRGAKADVTFVDEAAKVIFISIQSGSVDVFKQDDEIDNTDQFFASEAKISKITYALDSQAQLDGILLANISPSSISASATELASVTWSTSPNFPGNLILNSNITLTDPDYDPLRPGGEIFGQGTPNGDPPTENFSSTKFKITAKNIINQSTTFDLNLSVINKPIGLSYNRQLLLYVDTNTYFSVGEQVVTNNGARGQVREVIDTDTIVIDLISGEFQTGDSLDDYIFFTGEKALISAVKPFNAVFITNEAFDATNPMTIGSYLFTSNPGGTVTLVQEGDNAAAFGGHTAIARIQDTEENGAADRVYVNVIQGRFVNGDNLFVFSGDITAAITAANTTGSLTRPESRQMRIVLTTNPASPNDFEKGDYITADSADGDATAYINYVDPLVDENLHVEPLSIYHNNKGFFSVGDDVDDVNPFVASATTIANLTTSREFVLNVGESFRIEPNLVQGDDTVYTVSPSFPDGVTLNPTTGVISGSPTASSGRNLYVITARNVLGTSSYAFYMEIRKTMRLVNQTEDASSFVLHREGQANHTASCMITEEQVNRFNSTGLPYEINCRLEAGELDLYKSGINFNALVDKGLCDFVSLSDYYTHQFPVVETQPAGTAGPGQFCIPGVNGCPGAVTDIWNPQLHLSASAPTNFIEYDFSACNTAEKNNCDQNLDGAFDGNDDDAGACESFFTSDIPICYGDYSRLDSDYPNCDEGSYQVAKITFKADTGNCVFDKGQRITITCGGNAANCMLGAAQSNYSDALLENGQNSVITPAFTNGFQSDWAFDAPIDRGSQINQDEILNGNIFLSNWADSTSCVSGNYTYHAGAWSAYSGANSPIDMNPSNVASFPVSNTFNSDGISAGDNMYTFTCYDPGNDPKAIIRVMVRDWDKDFKPDDPIDYIHPDSQLALAKQGSLLSFPGADIDDDLNYPMNLASGAGAEFTLTSDDREDWVTSTYERYFYGANAATPSFTDTTAFAGLGGTLLGYNGCNATTTPGVNSASIGISVSANRNSNNFSDGGNALDLPSILTTGLTVILDPAQDGINGDALEEYHVVYTVSDDSFTTLWPFQQADDGTVDVWIIGTYPYRMFNP